MKPSAGSPGKSGKTDMPKDTGNRRIPHDTLVRLSDYLGRHMGLFYPPKKWNDLERQILKSLTDFKFEDCEAFTEWLLSSSPPTRSQIEILASHLTIGETYFFREKQVFEILEGRILPGLISARRGDARRIRIWSAGCCTGEEPYSIAILLTRMLPDWKNWNLSILATDINPGFLHRASEGIYSPWSFRDCPSWVREGYFRKAGKDRFEIADDIRKMVTFAYHNLVDDSYPSLANQTNAMDVIFCRNVLMYFSEETAKGVASSLSHSLVEGGWLVMSPSESQYVPSASFTAVRFPNAILYRKDSGHRKEIEIIRVPPDFRHEKTEEPAKAVFDYTAAEDIAPVREIREPLTVEAEETGADDTRAVSCEKARALYEQGRYGAAVQELLTLVSCDPHAVDVLSLLTRAYANQGDLTEALSWCERAIESDKFSPGLHYLRATILQERGAFEEALRSLNRVLYLEPDFVLAHFAMGILNHHQGKVREANRNFENVLLLLRNCPHEETLPESDGITAGRLAEIVQSIKREKELECLKRN